MKFDKRYHKTLVFWATDCAEHVLSCLEEKYSTDARLRNLPSWT